MKKKVLLASMFWITYYVTFAILFSRYAGLSKALSYLIWVVLFQAIMAYVNLWLLIPYLFGKKRFILYAFGTITTLLLLTVVRFQIPASLTGEGRGLFSLKSRMIAFAFYLFIAYSVSTAYYFVMEWFRNLQLKAELKYQQVESELKYLKSQINPHFLFNTLNNIYTLCYLKDDKAAPAVMKLSEMMRYMLHDSDTQLIELEREIQFINNYLELQQLKKEEAMKISFEIKGVKGRHKIAPLLIISFFENCFKHGDIEINPLGWIEASLIVNDANEMVLSISNSKKPAMVINGNNSHVGLENVKKRLSILYEGRYQLQINEKESLYSVALTLKLDV